MCQSQWPPGLRRRSAAARLLRSWVRIPPGAWMFVYCDCCVLSGRGLCDELITRPEESYRLWCVVVRDLETSRMRRPQPALGRSATGGRGIIYICMFSMLLLNFLHYVFLLLGYVFLFLCILLLVYIFLLLCTLRSGYSVSLCCSVYCLCVNVYCTTATGCQHNCK